jgi:formylglycine-generating enzyme required for sulfatase activity
MDFVLIPAGSFMMGSTAGDFSDDKPIHRVTITEPFYIGKYEVTQEQWQALMGSNPSKFPGARNPVECVTWPACQGFLEKLKPLASGMTPRLPTEAEWEYACRAGSTSEFYYGDGEEELWKYAWFGENAKSTHPVGEKEPNAWGLYDMLGNVQEWCSDWYGLDYYRDSPKKDPSGPASGKWRVNRGGSWFSAANGCRSSGRDNGGMGLAFQDQGFRVVLEIK